MFDAADRTILMLLQENARISNAEIARRLEMAPSAVLERIRKLEARGVLRGYEARVSPAAIGLGLAAFMFVRVEEGVGSLEFGAALADLAQVQEVHHIAGEDCYLLKIRVADTEALGRFLRERLGSLPHVRSTRTTIVLHTVKESGRVPIPAAPEPREANP
jgi:Lrp/AsnC family leucine-responsive transcriptional regulator